MLLPSSGLVEWGLESDTAVRQGL